MACETSGVQKNEQVRGVGRNEQASGVGRNEQASGVGTNRRSVALMRGPDKERRSESRGGGERQKP